MLGGVAAAEFGVGGGQVPLVAGGGVPVGPVGHDGGEHLLALAVGVLQGLVADGQPSFPFGVVVVAALGGGAGAGGGAQGGQAGLPGGGADLAELVALLRGPRSLQGVGVAQVQQRPVGQAAHVGTLGRSQAARASCQVARRSGAAAAGSGPIGSAGSP